MLLVNSYLLNSSVFLSKYDSPHTDYNFKNEKLLILTSTFIFYLYLIIT